MTELRTKKQLVIEYLLKRSFVPQSMAPNLYLNDDSTRCACEFRPDGIVTGAWTGAQIVPEGHGIVRIEDYQREIAAIIGKKEKPAPKEEPKDSNAIGMAIIGTLVQQVDNVEKLREVKQPEGIRKPDVVIPAIVHSTQGSMIKGFIPQLKELGKIKIGRKSEKKTSTGFRLPEKIDHFEVVSLIRDEEGTLKPDEDVMMLIGTDCKELDVMLLYNDPTLNFLTWYAAYQGGKCMCKGDGQIAKTREGAQIECDPNTCETFIGKKCKPNGILSVILAKSPRLGGVYKFRTTSYNSIRNLLGSMFFLQHATGGILAGLPLKLTVSPMSVSPKDSKTAQTIYVVNLEYRGTMEELLNKTMSVAQFQNTMRTQIIQLETTARAALTVPETEEEITDTIAEFYPEQQGVKI